MTVKNESFSFLTAFPQSKQIRTVRLRFDSIHIEAAVLHALFKDEADRLFVSGHARGPQELLKAFDSFGSVGFYKV